MRPIALAVVLGLAGNALVSAQTRIGVGDVDEDGLVDRLISIDRVLAVELGRVDGSFERIGEVETGGSSVVWMLDLDADGHLDIVAAVQPPASITGRVFAWTRGHGDGSFDPIATLPGHPDGLLGADVDDLDGDGLADLVGVSLGGLIGPAADIVVHHGLGAAGFAPFETVASTEAGAIVEIADVSGDGRADLIVGRADWPITTTTHTVPLDIWLADPAGGFVPGPTFAPDGPNGWPIAADLDADSLLDLIVLGGTHGASTASVYQGLGGGSFAPGTPITGLPTAASHLGARLGDLDDDGRLDLLVPHAVYVPETFAPNSQEDEGLTVLRGRGDLTFERWQSVPGALDGLLHDADLDGDLDLVGAYLVPNLGDGRLSSVPSVRVGNRPDDVLSVDVDGDSRLDLVVLQERGSRVEILRGRPGARFEPMGTLDHGFEATVLRTGDLDGDGHPDLVLGGDQLVAFLGDGTGQFVSSQAIDLDLAFANVTLGDMRVEDVHGDGVLDILALTYTAGSIHGSSSFTVARGVGDGTFLAPATAFSQLLYHFDGGDLNGDGAFDVVILSKVGNQLRFGTYLGQPDGIFAFSEGLSPYPLGGAILVADMDGDGLDDVTTIVGGLRRFYRGRGDGSVDAPLVSADAALPLADIRVADATDDGLADLIYPFAVVVPGRGDGTFGEQQGHRAGAVPVATAIGDFNDDGTTDLAVANRGSDDVSILLQGLPTPWAELGGALAGAAGEPRLVAGGTLEDGSLTTVMLTRAVANADGVLIAGARLAGQPLAGGILWPLPDLTLPLRTDANGTWTTAGRWPDNLPPGYQLHLQAWLVDAAGPQGFAASNGLTATVR